jgi:hypothetical protein
MLRRALVAAFALSVAAAAVVLVAAPRWGGEAVGEAERPALFETVLARTLDFQTAYLSGPAVVQVDVVREVLTIDDPGRARVHWDGTRLWYTAVGESPIALPTEWSDRVRVVWDEWRAGFPHAVVVEASPQELDPYWSVDRIERYVRLDLPYPWLAPYAVYVRTNLQGTWGSVTVMDRATKQPLRVGTQVIDQLLLTEAEKDVPLDPDTYAPAWPAYAVRPTSRASSSSAACMGRCPKRHLPWHDLQSFVALEPAEGNDGNGPTVWSTCPTATTTEVASKRLVFRMPADPERVALAEAAAAECPNAVFRMAIEGSHDPGPGQDSCFSGRWVIVDTRAQPPLPVAQRSFERCRQGPSDDTLPYAVELPLPAGYDLSGLEVWVENTAVVRCKKKATTRGGTALLVPPEGRPTLSWQGCWPGFPP